MPSCQAEQVARRKRVMERVNRALDQAWPHRTGEAYASEMEWALSELQSIRAGLREAGGSPLELSRTCRCLAGVYADLAPTLGQQMLAQAEQIYREAERWLEGVRDPLERAKVDLSFGITLRERYREDEAFLREAERRLVSARPVLAASSPQHLGALDRALDSVRDLLKSIPAADAMDEDLVGLSASAPRWEEAGRSPRPQTEPQLSQPPGSERFRGCSEPCAAVHRVPDLSEPNLRCGASLEHPRCLETLLCAEPDEAEWQDREVFARLRRRLDEEAAVGSAEFGRSQTLAHFMRYFSGKLDSKSAELPPLMNLVCSMRALMSGDSESVHYLNHDLDRPAAGSRAAALVERCWALRRFLLEELAQPQTSEAESRALFDLMLRGVAVDRQLYEAGAEDAEAQRVEREALRSLASEVGRFSARHHALLARPLWSGGLQVQVDSGALTFLGSSETRERVSGVCRQLGVRLTDAPDGSAWGPARWNQLRRAHLAIVELSDREGRERPAAGYELGAALTLGKPVLALVAQGQRSPFDLGAPAIELSGSEADARCIADAVQSALIRVPGRSSIDSLRDTARWVLECGRFRSGNLYVDRTLSQLQSLEADPDPIAINAALQALVGFSDDEQLVLLHPFWPPQLPRAGAECLFHSTRGRPARGDAGAESVLRSCSAAGVGYVCSERGGGPSAVRSIWETICRASHVLVDLTEIDVQVALELGIAHSLGRPTLLVCRDAATPQLFPMIDRFRVHRYARAAGGRRPESPTRGEDLEDLVGAFLSRRESAEAGEVGC